MTPRTGTPSLIPEPVFQRAEQPCEDRGPQLSGDLAEPGPFTGYDPKQLAEDRDHKHFTGDGQFTEHEGLRVKTLSFHQSIIASIYDSAECIATALPESDLDDEQLRALMASPLHLQERKASAERSQVYHSERENLMSTSSQDPISTGKPVAFFSSQSRLNQDTFSDRDDFSLRHQQVFGSNEPFIKFSNLANEATSLLDGNRDHLPTEARSEFMMLEYKVESLNTCIHELQQQTCAKRLELEDAHHGYLESRLQEELVMKEKAFRDTQIRSIKFLTFPVNQQSCQVLDLR